MADDIQQTQSESTDHVDDIAVNTATQISEQEATFNEFVMTHHEKKN